MKYYNSILDLIGKTPLVKLNKLTKERGIKATVLAKLESFNPGGSVKDRIGISMIEAAEKDGSLKPGGTIVEATSGNTGIGLALVASLKGYNIICVMTEKASVEKRNYLKALGAEVVVQPMTAKIDEPEHYVNTAKRIASEIPNSIFPYQYENPNNPGAHYKTTGPEIWEATGGKITHFVSGIGTGGTISGTGRFLKEKNPGIKVIGADPFGSIFKIYKETGKSPEPIPYLVEGIGQDVIPKNVDFKYIDYIINVSDVDSIDICRQLGKKEGIFCGASSGTIAYGALEAAKDLGKDDVLVFIICDTGERYLTKYHSDDWMREKKIMKRESLTIGQVIQTKRSNNLPKLISVKSNDRVFTALELMDRYNVTIIPVIDNSGCVGSLKESDLINKVIHDRTISDREVKEVMDKKLSTLDFSENIKTALEILKDHNAVLVSQHGNIIGILTRYDVLDFA